MNSQTQNSAFKLIELYLRPGLPQRAVALAQLKIETRVSKIKDPVLKEVETVRASIQLLEKKRKQVMPSGVYTTEGTPVHQSIKHLSPVDFVSLLSRNFLPIPLDILSIALQTPQESILFRIKQLERQFAKDIHSGSDLIKSFEESMQTGAPEKSFQNLNIVQRFQNLPFFIRFGLETTFIIFILIAVLWAVPELRNRYENSIQKRINDYLIENSLVDSPAPAGTSKQARAPEPANDDGSIAAEEESLTKSSSNQAPSRKVPKVNEGEVWRFSFTGSATSELETAINEAITKQNIDSQKPIVVPGGVQYDLILGLDQVVPFKVQLENKVLEIQSKSDATKTNPMSLANFSWYKKRTQSTRKVPPAHVQVVIWISTL